MDINETWDLTPLYESFKSEHFLTDFQKAKDLAGQIVDHSACDLPAAQKIQTYLDLSEEFSSLTSKTGTYAELVQATNTSDKEANEYVDKMDSLLIELRPAQVKFQRWLSTLDNFDELVDSPSFKPFKFFLSEQKAAAAHLLSDEEEVLAAKLEQSGSLAWEKLFNQLWSKHSVPITLDGEQKELPLAQVRGLAQDKNPLVRKTAYEAELKSYSKMDIGVAAALNGIKGEVITMAKKRGFASPLEMTLRESAMEKDTLDAMFGAMNKFLPSFQKYLTHKSKLLGHDGGLPFYDLFAPIGESNTTFTYDFTKDYIIKQFGTFSDELASFAKRAFDNRWVDLRAREGKLGGGFCASILPIKQSRILMNSTDSFDDLMTLAHELGHAYHNSKLYDEPSANTNYPMPLAETASIFCETIVFNSALKEANKEDKIAYLENNLASSTQVIVDIYSRFLFEDSVFKAREESSLDVDDLKSLMVDAQKKAYGSGLDHENLHPHMWACKPHYYGADFNYYNFPYAFGLLFAKGLYAQYEKEGSSFIPKYDSILNAAGKMSIVDVGKYAGIDLNSSQFWENSLRLIEKEIDMFIDLTR